MKNQIILNCLSEVLDISPSEIQTVAKDFPLLELGMTSLRFISFIVKVEEALDIEVLDSDLIFEQFATVDQLYKTLSKYFPNDESSLKKVLVLDADNVLWKGVVGEEPILIDEAVLEFHSLLLDLYKRGVLLCLCSKNRAEWIEQAFANPRMLLKKEHFAAFVANRMDKASNLRAIANELNLSPDSFVFADDSDYELGYIQLNFPEVECVKIDYADQAAFEDRLSSLFSHIQATSELNRTQLYREQKEREKEKHRFTSVKEYNASLETVVICEKASISECARLAELSLRTHQFNLSCRNYTQAELERLLTEPDYTILSLSVKDKYGDMGIVGMAVLHGTTIEAFMLSCRVFDRDLEYVLLNKIKEHTDLPLCGIYRQTDKNEQFAGFYPSNGVSIV